MSPFCEVCEKPFETLECHMSDCLICGQSCCKDCIDKYRICKDCDTSTSKDGKSLQRHTHPPLMPPLLPSRYGIIRVGVSGILWCDGKVLLGLRHPGDLSLPNHWCTPGGGVNFRETLRDALIREFKEETHLTITVGDIVTVTERISSDPPERHSVMAFYRVYSDGKPEVGEDLVAVDWFNWDELQKLPVTEQTMAALAAQFSFYV